MALSRLRNSWLFSDTGLLLLLALGRVLLQVFTNGQYGWHRDELTLLDNARHLAAGYVAYPPVTPLLTRLALELFGPSLVGVRLFAVLIQAAAMLLTGLMARRMGAGRWAQLLAAAAVALTPAGLLIGHYMMYVAFDFLAWVLIAYCMVSLLATQNPRWWLALGAAIGLGMLNKYTVAFFVAALGVGALLTPVRRYWKSPWLWGGAALALLVFSPNLLWQVQNDFISLEFLQSIHARDVEQGRAMNFLPDQLLFHLNPATLILIGLGLWFTLRAAAGKPWRILGWTYLAAFVLLFASQGRGYYLVPAYPMLIAAGAVYGEQLLAGMAPGRAAKARGVMLHGVWIGGLISCALVLPLAPPASKVWEFTSELNGEFKEEIGWEELVQETAKVYHSLAPQEQARTAILAGNYGEAGAVNLFGPQYGLPGAISSMNSYWERGYGSPPPETVIVLGYSLEEARSAFESCEPAGIISNPYGILNEETRWHSGIWLCRRLRMPWDELWGEIRTFG